MSWLSRENPRHKSENEKITERVNNLSFVLVDLQDRAVRADQERACLMTSIRLLFKDLESTPPINVIHSAIVHDKQQPVLEHSSDTNCPVSDHFVTIPAKTVFHLFLSRKQTLTRRFFRPPTLSKAARSEPSSDNNKRRQRLCYSNSEKRP